ncbi:MAG: OmpA family protein [Deltaproteobacteria bacterium]|nr:OmpA family protein [Deltaproteobacteria bacterium]
MRAPSTVRLFAVFALISALAACGKAKYPACEGDDDCKEKSEVCVDKRCVECSSDTACVTKLGAGATCVQNACRLVKAECQQDTDCQGGKKCDANKKCIDGRVACSSDGECGKSEECFGGFCRERRIAENVSAQCRDVANPSRLALQSVSFDLDAAEIREDSKATLERNAKCLKEAPEQKVTLEGHCDERGTVEYNLSLGEHRSQSVAKYLERLGVDKKRMRVLSKGKAEPVCNQASDECYSKNRRVDFK